MSKTNDLKHIEDNITSIKCPCHTLLIPADSIKCPHCDIDIHKSKVLSIGVGCFILDSKHLSNSMAVAVSENGLDDIEIVCANTIQGEDICNHIIALINSILHHNSECHIAFSANNTDDSLFEKISSILINNNSFTTERDKKRKINRLIIGNNFLKEEGTDECLKCVTKPDNLSEGERVASICAVNAIRESYKLII